CGPLATYRPVSCLSASTICRCITACKSDGSRAGLHPGHREQRVRYVEPHRLCGFQIEHEQEARRLPDCRDFSTVELRCEGVLKIAILDSLGSQNSHRPGKHPLS